MTEGTPRAAVILAGGRSTRFGRADKAIATLVDRPMIVRVADRLATVVEGLVVNCRAEQRSALAAVFDETSHDPTFAVDAVPDRGPVAGIMYGLRAAVGPYAAVVGCDMPFVEPPFIDHLFAVAEGHDAAVPRLEDQWFQTTQAVYHTEAMAAACEQVLQADKRKILDALFELDYRVVDEEEIRRYADRATFENINTREELAAAADRIEERAADR